ncbi:MAG: DNA methyltransferase [Acidobacteria bacterium]|nr:DNA methyltransferase [Acidobacteriota bacterium]
MPAGKYRVIYADPPWSYNNSGFNQSAESHYPTMPVEEVCALPVGELAGEGSVVFLWATSPLLPDALRVLEAWGATYKAGMVWVKPTAPGMGWWVRTRHEHLLIASFGGNEQPATMPDSVIEFPRSAHSKKPGSVYDTIEEMYPGPYVELFARNERDGWSRWGNELMDGAA